MIIRIILFVLSILVFIAVAFNLLCILGNNRKKIDGQKNARNKNKMQDRLYR